MKPTNDLGSMSLQELETLQKTIGTMIARGHAAKRDTLRQELIRTAAERGFKLGELFEPEELFGRMAPKIARRPIIVDINTVAPPPAPAQARNGAKVKAKYANPRNKRETWAGRGRRPRWLAKQLKRRGARLEQFAIRHV